MKNLWIAVIAVAALSGAAPFANATDDTVNDDDVVRIFAEAILGAETVQGFAANTQDTVQPQAVPAAVGVVVRLVFTVETFRLLLDTWDHIVRNWEFYRLKISDGSYEWVELCSLISISKTTEVPEVMLRCPDRPASLRSESE